ncbi:MAG: isochorismatase family protein, partial [Armatimonadetes bacterium]|nr:isochorismatase family protein [Armatimonadota bacterium]
CVESTARGAVHHNYYVVCVEDAMATPNPVLHQAALAIMRQRYDVVTSGHLVAMWEGAMRTVGP